MVGLSLCALKLISADVYLSLLFCAAIPRPPPGDIHKNSGLVLHMYAHAYLCMHTFVGVRVVWPFGCVCMHVRFEYWVSALQHCRDG